MENKKQNLIVSSIVGLIFSLPVTGFLYGFLFCEDCELGFSGFLGRIFIGFIESIMTTITLGKPYDNEAGTSSTNIRVFVLLNFVIITYIYFQYLNKKHKLKNKSNEKNRS